MLVSVESKEDDKGRGVLCGMIGGANCQRRKCGDQKWGKGGRVKMGKRNSLS